MMDLAESRGSRYGAQGSGDASPGKNVALGRLLETRGVDASINPTEYQRSLGRAYNRTQVELGVTLGHVLDLSTKEGAASMMLTFHLEWRDPRLEFTRDMTYDYITLFPYSVHGKIWAPELYIPGAIDPVFLHEAKEEALLVLRRDGLVRLSFDARVVIKVDYRLGMFPFDKQVARLHLREWSAHSDELLYVVNPKLVETEGYVARLPDWRVGRMVLEEIEAHAWTQEFGYKSQQFHLTIPFRRHPEAYLTKTILPILLITLSTGTVFWMDGASAGPPVTIGRMSMTLLSLLSAILYYSIISHETPNTPDISILDLFFITSLTWCVVALTVMVVVNVLKTQALDSGRGHLRLAAYRIDVAMRVLYPLGYLLTEGAVLLYGAIHLYTDSDLFNDDVNDSLRTIA